MSIEPYTRNNQKYIREAIQKDAKLYALVRTLDGWVHADEFWRINVYSEQDVQGRKLGQEWKWVEVDPLDPTQRFKMDDLGSFWEGPVIPYGRR